MPNKQGRKWITDKKRLAIYLRDGLACMWCGKGLEADICLTLDHFTPRERRGTNKATNLFTACHGCNSIRQNSSAAAFARLIAAQCERDPLNVYREINRRRQVSLAGFLSTAAIVIAERGRFTAALAYFKPGSSSPSYGSL